MERSQHDHMSQNRSFGSNHHPSSQSRKISIGVVVDSSAKAKGNHIKGVVTELPAENIIPVKEIVAEKQQKGKEVMAPTLGRANRDPRLETSPWFFTKSLYQKMSSSDTIECCKQGSSLPSTSNVLLQSSGRKMAAEKQSIHFMTKQMSVLHAGDTYRKKFNRMNYQRKRKNDGAMGREEEASDLTAQRGPAPEKELADQGTNERGKNGNETLRLKLQEILGTVSSPDKQQVNSKSLEMDANKSKPESIADERESSVAVCKQYSDTIETDSGSLVHTIRRPVTRSLSRKKPQPKMTAGRKKEAPLCQYKQAHLVKNEFSFAEAWSWRLSAAVNHASKMCKMKTSETEPVKTFFTQRGKRAETLQDTDGSKENTLATSLLESRTGNLIYSHHKKYKMVEPKIGTKEKAPHQLKTNLIPDQPSDNKGRTLQDNNVDQQDPFPQCNLKSPTFELKTATKISSPRYLFQINHKDNDVDSPAERAFSREEIHGFKSLRTSKGGQDNVNTQLGESPVVKLVQSIKEGHKENRRSTSLGKEVDSGRSADSSPITVPVMSENPKENRWSRSPREELDSESSQDGFPVKGCCSELVLETGIAGSPTLVLNSSKRLCIQKPVVDREFSPATASPKGHLFTDEDGDEFHRPSEEDGEDGLAGAVSLFALALKRVKSKILATTSRRAADILMSVSKNIQLQLQTAESMIQIEIGKVTSLGNSKRKRLESQYEEQQEQLKQIYQRFNEEVDQHLQNCKNTLEQLEAHRIEVKGTLEKQRLSNRKLLLQTKTEVGTQLNNAQRRLEGVNRLAREKMLQLKFGIVQCLKKGILS